mmetsp:Transcript_36365/g.81763  ORF Transcript_36365/g.81763 Transcript_36365/m.81763 type:complete len:228 (-) Transcript_36365:255-938(-)
MGTTVMACGMVPFPQHSTEAAPTLSCHYLPCVKVKVFSREAESSKGRCRFFPSPIFSIHCKAYLNPLFTKDELFPGGFIRSSRINLQPWSRRRETLTPRYQERDARSAHFLRLGHVPSERLDEIIRELLLELVPPPPPFAAVLVPDVPDLPLLHRARDLPEPRPRSLLRGPGRARGPDSGSSRTTAAASSPRPTPGPDVTRTHASRRSGTSRAASVPSRTAPPAVPP